jgi:ferritin-like metal-binding protein YciE
LIAAAQRVEHYEIAGYGTAEMLAMELNLAGAERLLGETLDEESAADDESPKSPAWSVTHWDLPKSPCFFGHPNG